MELADVKIEQNNWHANIFDVILLPSNYNGQKKFDRLILFKYFHVNLILHLSVQMYQRKYM